MKAVIGTAVHVLVLLKVVIWQYCNGPEAKTALAWDSYTFSIAAMVGHLAVLQWAARSQGCPLDSFTCSSATSGGNLAVLEWLRSEGCPWDRSTCSGTALGGHLAVLQ